MPLPTIFRSFMPASMGLPFSSSFRDCFVSAFSSLNFSSSAFRNERRRLLSFSVGCTDTSRRNDCSESRRLSTNSISKRFIVFFSGIGGMIA